MTELTQQCPAQRKLAVNSSDCCHQPQGDADGSSSLQHVLSFIRCFIHFGTIYWRRK